MANGEGGSGCKHGRWKCQGCNTWFESVESTHDGTPSSQNAQGGPSESGFASEAGRDETRGEDVHIGIQTWDTMLRAGTDDILTAISRVTANGKSPRRLLFPGGTYYGLLYEIATATPEARNAKPNAKTVELVRRLREVLMTNLDRSRDSVHGKTWDAIGSADAWLAEQGKPTERMEPFRWEHGRDPKPVERWERCAGEHRPLKDFYGFGATVGTCAPDGTAHEGPVVCICKNCGGKLRQDYDRIVEALDMKANLPAKPKADEKRDARAGQW